jgi:hypothetical protein
VTIAPRSGFLRSGDPRWSRLLEGTRHDVYQLPSYVELAAKWHEPGEGWAWFAQDDRRSLLVPLVLRAIPGAEELRDAISPRGFAGPVIGGQRAGPDDDFLDAALTTFHHDLQARGIVSAFVRLHPLLSPPLPTLARHGEVVDHGDSVSIDLTRSAEELWGQLRVNHRRDIRRALREGYVARMDEAWQRFDDFVEAYRQSMDRLGAAAHWRLSHDYFAELRDALGPHLHLCVVEKDGGLAAASLVTEVEGMAEYHLAGTMDTHVQASPSKLVIHFLTAWARARRAEILHLAGSLRRDDALSHFKLGFSPDRHPLCSWRLIADEAAYAELVRVAQPRLGARAGAGHDSSSRAPFFPAYRAGSDEAGSAGPGEAGRAAPVEAGA